MICFCDHFFFEKLEKPRTTSDELCLTLHTVGIEEGDRRDKKEKAHRSTCSSQIRGPFMDKDETM